MTALWLLLGIVNLAVGLWLTVEMVAALYDLLRTACRWVLACEPDPWE